MLGRWRLISLELLTMRRIAARRPRGRTATLTSSGTGPSGCEIARIGPTAEMNMETLRRSLGNVDCLG